MLTVISSVLGSVLGSNNKANDFVNNSLLQLQYDQNKRIQTNKIINVLFAVIPMVLIIIVVIQVEKKEVNK